jgi:hypothetical protein
MCAELAGKLSQLSEEVDHGPNDYKDTKPNVVFTDV